MNRSTTNFVDQERAPRLTFSAASVECCNSNSSFGCISSKWLEMVFSGVETAFGSLTQLGSSLFNSIGFTLRSLPRLRICREMLCVLTMTLLNVVGGSQCQAEHDDPTISTYTRIPTQYTTADKRFRDVLNYLSIIPNWPPMTF